MTMKEIKVVLHEPLDSSYWMKWQRLPFVEAAPLLIFRIV